MRPYILIFKEYSLCIFAKNALEIAMRFDSNSLGMYQMWCRYEHLGKA